MTPRQLNEERDACNTARGIVSRHDPDSFTANTSLTMAIAGAIAEAVLAERNRCAKIARDEQKAELSSGNVNFDVGRSEAAKSIEFDILGHDPDEEKQ